MARRHFRPQGYWPQFRPARGSQRSALKPPPCGRILRSLPPPRVHAGDRSSAGTCRSPMHGRRTDAGHSGHPPSTRSAWPASNGVPPDVDPLQECPVRARASPPFPITDAADGTWCMLSDAAAAPNGTRRRSQRGADMTASAARRACETRSFPRSPEIGSSPATRARRSGIMARMPARTRL